MVLKKILRIKDRIAVRKEDIPRHIALSIGGTPEWSRENKKTPEEAEQVKYNVVKEVIEAQVKLDVPIMTFFLTSKEDSLKESYALILDGLEKFFNDLSGFKLLEKNQMKVSVFGKWYDLPGRVVESIKEVIENTRDYDKFFINFCINYDGQQEIVDACKIIGMKINTGKIYPDSIDKQELKENIYSSYFMPPGLIIVTGRKSSLNGFLLWDSVHSKIVFVKKLWPDFTKSDLLKAISE